MERRRGGETVSDGEGSRRKKRRSRSRSRSASPGSRSQLRRDRRRPPLHGRGRKSNGGILSDRSDSRSSTRYRRNGRSRSRSRRKPRDDERSRTRTRSGAAKTRRHSSRGPRRTRARTDSHRRRRRSRSHSHSTRSRRSERARRNDRNDSRRRGGDRDRDRKADFERDDRGGDESDDSADHDDTVGSYEGKPGDYIASRYKIIREAGLGTFGRVLECLDKQRNIVVAIKVVRKVEKYTDSAKIEANILEDVNGKDANNTSLCVRMYKWFEYRGHVCMVFERLGCSLYDYLKSHDYQPFPLYCVRAFAWQLLTSLEFIHSIQLIHTDLKPENILLVDDEEERVTSSSPSSSSSYSSANGKTAVLATSKSTRQEHFMEDVDSDRLTCRPPANFATKLIDFGGATYDDESKSSIINTRQYRSPEVILGLGWSFPSDIWSAGCIIAELYIGELLFATHENLEHLALIERCIGPLPRRMTERADSHATKFFRHGRLDWPEGASNDESVDHVRRMRSLKQILRPEDAASGLLELLELMLVLDPEHRVTAKEALHHRFFEGFSMRNITNAGAS